MDNKIQERLVTDIILSKKDYDDMERKKLEYQREIQTLQSKLCESENQLKSLKNILEPAYEEFNDISNKFQIEKICREEAETYAMKMHSSNAKLKRQSHLLMQNLSKVDFKTLEIVINETEKEGDENTHIEILNNYKTKIKVLEEEKNQFEKKLKQLEQIEKESSKKINMLEMKIKRHQEELLKSVTKISEYEDMIANFKRTSTFAIQEYLELQNQISLEKNLKMEAEKVAHKYYIDRETMVRQSSILLSSTASDDRLQSALLEIENLTKLLENNKENHKIEMSALKIKLCESEDIKKIEILQSKLDLASEEIDRFQKAIVELEKWKNETLIQREKQSNEITNIETTMFVPPPPPPPPCPPPVPFLALQKKSIPHNRKLSVPGPSALSPGPSNQDILMEEMKNMMKRITSGKNTMNRSVIIKEPVNETNKPPQVMVELQKMFQKSSTRKMSLSEERINIKEGTGIENMTKLSASNMISSMDKNFSKNTIKNIPKPPPKTFSKNSVMYSGSFQKFNS